MAGYSRYSEMNKMANGKRYMDIKICTDKAKPLEEIKRNRYKFIHDRVTRYN